MMGRLQRCQVSSDIKPNYDQADLANISAIKEDIGKKHYYIVDGVIIVPKLQDGLTRALIRKKTGTLCFDLYPKKIVKWIQEVDTYKPTDPASIKRAGNSQAVILQARWSEVRTAMRGLSFVSILARP